MLIRIYAIFNPLILLLFKIHSFVKFFGLPCRIICNPYPIIVNMISHFNTACPLVNVQMKYNVHVYAIHCNLNHYLKSTDS